MTNSTIYDGCGTGFEKCDRKHCGLHIVRPGKAQCDCDHLDALSKPELVDIIMEGAARIAELESELVEQARLNGMGSEREAAKDGKIAELKSIIESYNHFCKGEGAHVTLAKQQAIIDKLPHAVTSTTGTLLAAFRFECHAEAYRDTFQGSGLPTIALQAEPMPWKSISTPKAAQQAAEDAR